VSFTYRTGSNIGIVGKITTDYDTKSTASKYAGCTVETKAKYKHGQVPFKAVEWQHADSKIGLEKVVTGLSEIIFVLYHPKAQPPFKIFKAFNHLRNDS